MAVVENRIFINNVPQSARREDLNAHFSQFGATVDVYMPAAFHTAGGHKGICFVTFATPESVDLAMKSPAHVIHGQTVTVEMCLAKKGEGKGTPGYTNTGERVFVTNIGPEVTLEEVQAYFAQWGDWTDLYMPRGSFPAGHKGICFISYKDPAAVAQVLQHGTHHLRGQPIVVDVAVPRGDSKGVGKGPSLSYPSVAVPGQGSPGYPAYTATSWTLPSTDVGGTLPGRLFLTKMDRTLTKEDLTVYFQQFGDLNDVYVPQGGKQIAFVGFCNASATQAILHRKTHEIKPGCTVDVDMAIERPPLGAKGQGKVRFHPY
mmetsp:Transcript_95281/g.253091  ORF Transcript_95281/g.253091 Transcript_95281/m.253091 type:complete len:317 (-) Transcript_95281:107-1057(-)|eukprot:CAMPEP_0171198436 /NCGR_PEP_ID=MMETSP0790-20130122/22938_1 /TAXON_ID=2925 /ORGANISM="Alexandrium catenella, Strain OF101" /LENGTH=316 /DNA_ID=CAMNT_0011663733 /DNA_START=144 /DNA_END=1094 /DNA_ORIENTATION=-